MLGNTARDDNRSQLSQHSLPPDHPTDVVTVAVLDSKLNSLLHDLTHSIAKEVGKIAHKLRGEIDQIGEHTNTLENKFDELTQYVHVLEEDNSCLKHTISQLQLQQEDLENCERRQNLRIRGIPEAVSDKELCSCLLGLFVTLAPHRLAHGQGT